MTTVNARRAVLVANFDCERTWGGGAPLPARVARRLAPLAPLMRALVPADVSWRLAGMGAPVEAEADEALLAWGALGDAPEQELDDGVTRASFPLAVSTPNAMPTSDEALWALLLAATPHRAAAIAGSDRREVASLHDALGIAFGPMHHVDTMGELQAVLATSAAPFVLKPSLTAAGRDRVVVAQSSDFRTFDIARGLLRDHGRAIVEPWVTRTRDVGQAGLLTSRGELHAFAPHEIVTSSDGTFIGARVHADDAWLPAPWRAQLAAAFVAAAQTLAHVGYRGPFGIDAFAYQTAAGEVFRPLCEINPRLTFGWLAQAWARRLGSPGLLTLRRPSPAQGPTALALTTPVAASSPAAWFVPAPAA
ncbi:MAG: ATP-grasp domain-containing protein [Myxococcales bacterium]|nr:ATP-grasp domain-containing protein [Myxococcales bacterium]